jgi:protein-L-isoaspartate O-methyltransferase
LVSEAAVNWFPRTLAFVLCLVLARVSFGQDSDQGTADAEPVSPLPDVVFIPTPHDVVARMLELVTVGKNDVVYDLGCGDGRIVVAAAKMYGCRAVGLDIDPIRVKASRENVKKNHLEDLVTVERRDFFKADLRPATVVTVYLSARYNGRLIPQFEKLQPGSRIVSHLFDMPGVTPDKIVHVTSREDGRKHTLYLWTTPLKRRD